MEKLTAQRDAIDAVAFMRAGLDALSRRVHDIHQEDARTRITAYCEQIIEQAEALTALCDELTHKTTPVNPHHPSCDPRCTENTCAICAGDHCAMLVRYLKPKLGYTCSKGTECTGPLTCKGTHTTPEGTVCTGTETCKDSSHE